MGNHYKNRDILPTGTLVVMPDGKIIAFESVQRHEVPTHVISDTEFKGWSCISTSDYVYLEDGQRIIAGDVKAGDVIIDHEKQAKKGCCCCC